MMTALQKIQVAINRARRLNAAIAPIPVKTLEEVIALADEFKKQNDELKTNLENYQKAIITQPGEVIKERGGEEQ